MSKEALPAWADELAEAFRRAGPGVVERPLLAGNAYIVEGRLVGHVELRSDALRVQLRLPDPTQRELEARPTFDPRGPRPALAVVTRDDLDYALSLVSQAYRHARAESPESPSAPRTNPPHARAPGASGQRKGSRRGAR